MTPEERAECVVNVIDGISRPLQAGYIAAAIREYGEQRAAEERAGCAQICDDIQLDDAGDVRYAANRINAAIRARGTKDGGPAALLAVKG